MNSAGSASRLRLARSPWPGFNLKLHEVQASREAKIQLAHRPTPTMTSTHAPKRTEATGAAAEGVLREEAEELRSRPSASSHSGIAHTDGAPVASAIAEPGEPGEPEESREPGTGANARAPHAAYDAEGSPGTDAEAAKGTHDPPIAPPPPPEHNLLQALQDIQTNPVRAVSSPLPS